MAPTGDRSIHVIKHDGYRLAVRIDAGDVRLLSRRDHIGPLRDHIAIKVRVDRRIVVAIRRANIPLARLDPEAIGPHDAGDTLVIDEVASSLKLVCYASVSIARQLVLDVL